jgi:ABC-2 type transport system ATP-binding protein
MIADTSATAIEAASGDPVVCEGLVVGYRGIGVLGPLSATFRRGVTAIVGRNGAGKSTLLRTLATLLRPIEGTFSIGGDRGTARRRLPEIRHRLGFVSQRPDFPSSFTVDEMLVYTAAVRRIRRADAVDAVCEQFDLGRIRSSRIGEISGGERQRAFLAQATVHRPPLLLLDEPTVGLDIPSRHEFKRYVRAIASERTVLFTTHLVDDLIGVADHVFVVGGRGGHDLGALDQILDECAGRDTDLGTYIAGEL